MNERIKELAEKAGMEKYPVQGINTLYGDKEIEKFAELIVQECANIVNSLEQYEGQGDCSTAEYIKERFGVDV